MHRTIVEKSVVAFSSYEGRLGGGQRGFLVVFFYQCLAWINYKKYLSQHFLTWINFIIQIILNLQHIYVYVFHIRTVLILVKIKSFSLLHLIAFCSTLFSYNNYPSEFKRHINLIYSHLKKGGCDLELDFLILFIHDGSTSQLWGH